MRIQIPALPGMDRQTIRATAMQSMVVEALSVYLLVCADQLPVSVTGHGAHATPCIGAAGRTPRWRQGEVVARLAQTRPPKTNRSHCQSSAYLPKALQNRSTQPQVGSGTCNARCR
ncbi:hypothetical protein F0H33_10095 [Xanthomonas translucens pv. undulosa]|nr:hypothetical protein F0H33_10095 [Xanthomonas translucens pv. undulosa]